jgi:hypothetical protein
MASDVRRQAARGQWRSDFGVMKLSYRAIKNGGPGLQAHQPEK